LASGPVAAGQSDPAAPAAPRATCPADGQCFADVLPGSPFYDYANNLYKQDIISGYACGGVGEPCDDQNRPYYRPTNSVTRAQITKFVDLARKQPGIYIDTATDTLPLYSRTTAPTGSAKAVSGESVQGIGVYGKSVEGYGLYGSSSSGYAVAAFSNGGTAVYGEGSDGGYAGYFYGQVFAAGNMTVTNDLRVNGTCTGCTGPSVIDHPLDPANKYLYHSAVESQDMKNIYDGMALLDSKGEAWVALPEWFGALNKEYRYQLTAVGAAAPGLFIAEKIKDNRFKIAGGKAGMEVSWQVTGTRHDPYSEQNRTPVEQDKPEEERGLYLHPEAYGQPESKQIGKADLPQLPSPQGPQGTQP
jgi:hypothetical protein